MLNIDIKYSNNQTIYLWIKYHVQSKEHILASIGLLPSYYTESIPDERAHCSQYSSRVRLPDCLHQSHCNSLAKHATATVGKGRIQ